MYLSALFAIGLIYLWRKIFSPLFVEEFAKEMSTQSGISVEADFRKYTYGGQATGVKSSNPIHRKMSLRELKNLL